MKDAAFVSANFSVPQTLEAEQFTLLPIRPEFAELDFAAVMQSVEQLRNKFGSEWPADDFSIDQNRDEIEIHCGQFARRESFTYSVLSVKQDRILGCVYIVPNKIEPSNAEVIYWIRSDERSDRLENSLKETLQIWLHQDWDFPNFHIEP